MSGMANSSLPQFAITTGRNMLAVAMGRYRLTEERLLPGHICLMGWFQTLNNAESSLLRVLGTFLRDRKQDQVALFSRFNRNTDGEIDGKRRVNALSRRCYGNTRRAHGSLSHLRWLNSIQIAAHSLFPPPHRRHSFAAVGVFLSQASPP